MNKAFTLIELLVVVAIMGLLGTVSVGGYRQMRRGMEERGVIDNASKFIALASERAQIDRHPTAVYFWNEMIREETDTEPAVVVGRAVAIRTKGRISEIDGQCLVDEFGDLEQFDEDGEFIAAGNQSQSLTRRLYLMDDLSGDIKYSIVYDTPEPASGGVDGRLEYYLSGDPAQDSNDKFKGKIVRYGYKIKDKNGAGWKVGSRYGLEFQSIELPHNYIFGTKAPSSMSQPVVPVATLWFDAEFGSASGAAVGTSTISVSSLRPGQGGAVTAHSIGSTTKPNTQLN